MIVSLTDGYAFDVTDKTYCYGSTELIEYQKKTTYMSEYAHLISIAKNVNSNSFLFLFLN